MILITNDSSVNIVTGIDFRQGRWFFPSPPRPDWPWGPHSLLTNGYQRLFFPGGKAAGGEAGHSPPPSVEVKNARNYTYTPPIDLHGAVLI